MDFRLLLQIVGVALGLLYLWLEYRAHIGLWIVGLVMPCVHGLLYYRSGLYADCAMQVYYILAGLYGLAVWARTGHGSGRKEEPAARIVHTPVRQWPALVVTWLAVQAAIYWVLVKWTDSSVPFWDSLTTALCVVAYWMLSRRQVEQWLVWLVVDAVTVGLYFYKGIPLTAGLYLLYCVLAVAGYLRWRQMAQAQA